MNKAYNKIVWQNSPSTATPLNQTNLNEMSNALDTIDDRVIALDSGKVSSVTVTNTLQTGDTIATITVDGTATNIKSAQVEVDDTPSATSENPLQNKAIYEMLNNLLPEGSASGNPIAISDASGLNAKACSVDLLPIQDLSHGEPSPTNICPISGRTEVSVTRTGKNLAKDENHLWSISGQGVVSSNSGYKCFTVKVKQGDVLTFSQKQSSTLVIGYFTDVPEIGSVTYNNSRTVIDGVSTTTITAPIDGYVLIRTGYSNTECQIEYGSTATTYEPYTAETHTHTYASTVYGGVDDFVNGGLTNEWNSVLVDLGDLNWSYVSSGNRFTYSGLASVIKKPATDSVVADIISNQLKTLSLTALRSSEDNALIAVGDTGVISVRYTGSGTDPTQFKTDIAGTKIMFKIATPTTISTSAEEITLLKGNNVISTDGDNINLVYSADIKAWVENQLSNS